MHRPRALLFRRVRGSSRWPVSTIFLSLSPPAIFVVVVGVKARLRAGYLHQITRFMPSLSRCSCPLDALYRLNLSLPSATWPLLPRTHSHSRPLCPKTSELHPTPTYSVSEAAVSTSGCPRLFRLAESCTTRPQICLWFH